jgi:hypothetical protein
MRCPSSAFYFYLRRFNQLLLPHAIHSLFYLLLQISQKIFLHKIVAVTTGLPLEDAARNNFSLRVWKHCLVISENYTLFPWGPGSSVSIATGYGLGGPGIESWWGCNFSHTSRPALGPTQSPVQWVPGFPGDSAEVTKG